MTAALLSQPPAAPPAAAPGVPAGVPNVPAGGFPALFATLLAKTPSAGAPRLAPQTKPSTVRPPSKRQPGDSPTVTSLAAALLPLLPSPLAPVAFVPDDATGAGATSGHLGPTPVGTAGPLDPALPSPAPVAQVPVASATGSAALDDAVPDNAVPDNAVPDNAVLDGAVLDRAVLDDTVPDNAVPDKTVHDGAALDRAVLDDTVPDNAVPDNAVPDKTVHDGAALDRAVLDDTVPDNAVPDNAVPNKTVHDGAALDRAVLDDAVPARAVPENAALENALPTAAGRDLPILECQPELAFAVRLTAAGPLARSQPAAASGPIDGIGVAPPAAPRPAVDASGLPGGAGSLAPAKPQTAAAAAVPPPGPASVTPSSDSAADRAACPAAWNEPPADPCRQAPDKIRALPDRQTAGQAIQAHDSSSPSSAPPEPGEAAALQAERPGSPQGTSNEPREPESRRALPSASEPPENASSGVTATLAGASGPVPSAARERTPEAAAAPPQAQAPPEIPREQPREPAVRELSLALPGPSSNGHEAEQVSLRVAERAGEVQVAVRTADPQLADSLRQNLGDLVSDLAGRGYRTETWQPLAGSGTEASALPGAGGAAADSNAGQSFSGHAGDGSRHGGSPAGQQQQQQQRRGQDPSQPSWLQALTRGAAQTGSTPHDHTD